MKIQSNSFLRILMEKKMGQTAPLSIEANLIDFQKLSLNFQFQRPTLITKSSKLPWGSYSKWKPPNMATFNLGKWESLEMYQLRSATDLKSLSKIWTTKKARISLKRKAELSLLLSPHPQEDSDLKLVNNPWNFNKLWKLKYQLISSKIRALWRAPK